MTADLAASFRRLIRIDGPIPIARFMGESNARYYTSRDPLGSAGDFTTAPEISQMFGELVGLWLADVWDRAGRPAEAIYAELGPGRGTLATDAVRAMARAGLRPPVHFIEGSAELRARQSAAVPQARFHHDIATLPDEGPLLLVANEFLDALPIRQLVRTAAGWRERMVGLEGERFVFVAGRQPMDEAVPAALADAAPGTIVETNPGAAAIVTEIANRLARQGGTALLVDYGHLTPRTGSTLQALRMHRKVDPLAHPGEADLTAHVDFAVLAAIATKAGCRAQRAPQGAWLTAMGIGMRAAALSAAVPEAAASIASAHHRLTDSDEMGELFKVMALSGPGWPGGAGFAP